MNVMLGRVALAAFLVLGAGGAVAARDAAHGARNRADRLHGVGFNEPVFRSDLRTGKAQPYTWPVGDRYHPVSRPFYGWSY